MMPRIEINDVTKILLDAPRIAKAQSPFFWTYLDRPADGTVLLTWQPLARAGVQFATDGLFWAPPENYYKQDVGNGLVRDSTRTTASKPASRLTSNAIKYIDARGVLL